MARDKRSRRAPGADISADTPVDPEVARFAARVWQQEADQRDRQRAEREARRREEEHQALIAAKDAAVAEVKRLRTQEHAKAGDTEAADASYRRAVADLIAFETGSAPSWAPAPVVTPEVPDGADEAPDGVAEPEPGPDEPEPDEA